MQKTRSMLKKYYITLSVLLFLFCYNEIYSQTIGFHARPKGFFFGGQLTFDFYKPYGLVYFNLKRNTTPKKINRGQETEILSQLVQNLIYPRYILIQTTFYQLAALSSFLETDHRNYFNRFNMPGGINLMRSVGAGYEEPYAFTLFLGNVLFLSYTQRLNNKRSLMKQSGSAMAGFAFSTGNHQICDNIYLTGRWYQWELVVLGVLKEAQRRRLSWNFRAGVKYHNTPLFRDVFILSMERSHSQHKRADFALFKNSIWKYKAYIPLSFADQPPTFIYQYFSFGKKFPFRLFNKTAFLVLAGGIRWEWIYRYNRIRNTFEANPSGHFIWLIQPNIEF